MCGIAGAFAFAPGAAVDTARVDRMNAVLAHRGPDGEGRWSDPSGRVLLAHRRLSIIDIEGGAQPMGDAATGVMVVFNGEIYNYRELADEQRAGGTRFETRSDTEVLLRLYLRDGPDFVRSLRGMFAFALWDPRADRLLLARDRIGKKPLFYTIEDGCLYFASSWSAVRSGRPIAPDAAAVHDYMTLGYVPAPATIDRRIRKLPAATIAAVSRTGMELAPFWNPADGVEPFTGTWTQAVDRLDEIVQESVSIRLRSDVPLGVFLSGGIDSSLVAAVAARKAGTRIQTFSIGFEEADFDESAHARAVADRIGSEHRAFGARFDMLELLPAMALHFGEPFADPAAVPLWHLARETRRHVTVAVGGDGGDEWFGGYNWYGTALRLRRAAALLPPFLPRLAAGLPDSRSASGTPMRARRLLELMTRDEAGRFAALRVFLDPAQQSALLTPALLQPRNGSGPHAADLIAGLYRETAGSAMRRMRVVDAQTYLADCLMPKLDVPTMAHGLEARAPLLDQEIVRFALGLPDSWIRRRGTGKRLLRALLARYLPAALFDRPKHGFDVPLRVWFRRELRSSIENLPRSEALLDSGWFRREGVVALVDEHTRGERNHDQRLYNLLVLDYWLRAA